MNVELKMRNQVVESLCKKLGMKFKETYSNKDVCFMIFTVTGWDVPYFGSMQEYIERYWRRLIAVAPRASARRKLAK